MTDFLSKLFSISKESDDLADPGLMQGARFNKMQQQIEQPVYSHLPLMEQTTGAGLGSIKEPLENNSQLHSLDKKELEKLAKLENKYEELIDQLRKLQTKTRGSHKIDELQGEIKALNVKIMQQASKLVNHILMDRKKKYDALISQKNSLEGQYQDRQNELDAAYQHYIIWFIAAATLGVLTIRQLSK
jgi:DNA repair exonuclease SbcCD ATPase subunit